jgi:hypothetical protein
VRRQVLVDKLVRFENLTAELAVLAPKAQVRGVTASPASQLDGGYRAAYGAPQAAAVGRMFAEDALLFGYEF